MKYFSFIQGKTSYLTLGECSPSRQAVPCYCMTSAGTLKKQLYRSLLGHVCKTSQPPSGTRHTLLQKAPGGLACFQEVATCSPGLLRPSKYCHPNDRIKGRWEAFIPVLSKPTWPSLGFHYRPLSPFDVSKPTATVPHFALFHQPSNLEA